MKYQESSMVERLRPLVGRGGWDYCVVWEVSQEQRFLELKACCCAGAESNATIQAGEQELLSRSGFPTIAQVCRDTKFPQHRRTRGCEALADLLPSMPLDSSSSTMMHAQALESGIPAWTYPSQLREGSSTNLDEATTATRVLVPVPGGLVELFVQSHVPENQEIVHFVMCQFISPGAAAAFGPIDYQQLRVGLDGSIGIPSDPHTWVAPQIPSCEHPMSFPWDLHADQSRLCASSLNLFQSPRDEDGLLEGSADSIHSEKPPTLAFDPTAGIHGMVPHQMSAIAAVAVAAHTSIAESTVSRELGGGQDKESVKQEGEGRADSGMEGSDQGDDDEEQKAGRGRRLSCKNLMAERRRRKKLNDRLFTLRSLVPKISKMDRASILGDAIEFVKELQNQVKRLQDRLEETNLEDNGTKHADVDDHHLNNVDSNNINNINHKLGLGQQDKQQRAGNTNPGTDNTDSPKGTGGSSTTKTATTSKPKRSLPANEEKGNQMEPQVEVSQLVGANKFLLKVFCEHKRSGFVRLMEAMTSLGLDVITVNVTTSKPLVLNMFEVEKRDSEVVQPEHVRSSLLRLIMDTEDGGSLADSAMAVENAADYNARHRHQGNMHRHNQQDSHQHPQHPHCLHHRQP